MEKYTKDEINFHGFLTAYRTMQGVQMKELTRGLYSKSMMSRVEKGERLPRKLERDRLVARLGVSGEGYEDYLSREEYAEWVLRQEILESIEEKNVAKLEEQLQIYAQIEEKDKVENQFLEAMRFMYLKLQGASEEALRETIERAVDYTIPNIDEGFRELLILADQEINLLIEYVSLHRCGKTAEECQKWRRERYEDIMTYIEHSYMDSIGKAKVFTKLVYYICREYMDAGCTQEERKQCLALCNEAIELLRNTRKMYYFVELLEMRQHLIHRILSESNACEEAYAKELEALADTSDEWAKMLVGLYEEYEVAPYMENFVYLYLETESHCINRVVRVRRKMLKITQKTLAGEVCDIKTVRRTEHETMSPQMYVVRGMFGNLGLCPEYVRARVISTDAETFVLKRQLSKYSNEHNVEKWKETLDKLEKSLCMEIVQNKQAVYREQILLKEYTKEITTQETIQKLTELLELTVRVDQLSKVKELYLTVEEMNIMHNIAVRTGIKTKNIYFDVLRNYSDEATNKFNSYQRTSINELIVTGVANYLGDLGLYEESTALGEHMIKFGLRLRRMHSLAKNLYNNCWNKYNINNGEALARENIEVDIALKRCVILSYIMNNEKLKNFFVMMSNN